MPDQDHRHEWRHGLWPLFLVLLCGAGCQWLPHASKAAAETAAPARVLHLSSTVVNLAGGGGGAYLRIGISLALTAPAADDSQVQSVATDTVLTLASADTAAALLDPDGKQVLKRNILSRLQQRLPHSGIEDVYYDDFLVQP